MKNVLVVMLVVVTIGCGRQATGEAPSDQNPASGMPAGHPTAGPSQGQGVAGTVLETFDSAGYTYLRLETAQGEIWAAVTQTPMEVGAEVVIEKPMVMDNFKSTSLDRTFESIVFGSLAGAPGPGAMGGTGIAARNLPVESSGAIAVGKAEGENARTIGELYEQKEQLGGQSVTLRGQVVKYNAGIMGRNWIHLQDGTGDSGAGTHDITVTTMDQTAVGEEVEIEGVVVLDKDFGAGYRYAVIVEEASIRR